MITITFPDGNTRRYESGTTGLDIAKGISPRLAAEVLAMKANGQLFDVNRPIEEDVLIQFLKWEDEEGKQTFWHSSSHVMAAALEQIYPPLRVLRFITAPRLTHWILRMFR